MLRNYIRDVRDVTCHMGERTCAVTDANGVERVFDGVRDADFSGGDTNTDVADGAVRFTPWRHRLERDHTRADCEVFTLHIDAGAPDVSLACEVKPRDDPKPGARRPSSGLG